MIITQEAAGRKYETVIYPHFGEAVVMRVFFSGIRIPIGRWIQTSWRTQGLRNLIKGNDSDGISPYDFKPAY